jgi:hypothetical protein
MEASRVDPHLERVVGYRSVVRQAAVFELVPPFGGFVAAVVLMPDRWLRITALYVGMSCSFGLVSFLLAWRRLLPRLRGAPPVPPDAVEVKRRRRGLTKVWVALLEIGFLLGSAWVWAALDDDTSFASGLLFTAVLLSAFAVRDLATRWSIERWECRNGRVLTSLLLGKGEVFYVERGAHAA